MKPLSVEDGIVCEFCGTHCYKGAEHNARVEDNARFDDPKPAGVEDGMSDEQACICSTHDIDTDCPKHHFRRNEQPVLQRIAVPVEERTAISEQQVRPMKKLEEFLQEGGYTPHFTSSNICYHPVGRNACALESGHEGEHIPELQVQPPIPEERTAEMEQLMASLRAAQPRKLRRGNGQESGFIAYSDICGSSVDGGMSMKCWLLMEYSQKMKIATPTTSRRHHLKIS